MKKLKCGKHTENLVEITLVYAKLAEKHEKLKEIDSIAWGEIFVLWANEFEERFGWVIDFDSELGVSYLETINTFATEKILEYAGLEVQQ